jgi:4-amino-4-deoxy-L-arabinose transferase-like glycosyltransferase/uncharacterized membrane protein YkvA (DUF1232 family)
VTKPGKQTRFSSGLAATRLNRTRRQLISAFTDRLALYQRLLQHPKCPRLTKWLLGAAVAYAMSPVDLIPDFIPVIGHLDDLLIVPLLIFLATRSIPPALLAEVKNQTEPTAGKNVHSRLAASYGSALLLGLLAVYLAFGQLSATHFWGAHAESRRAEISREMLLPGASPLVPRLNGEAMLTKPPLFYWLQATAYRLTGRIDEAGARLPSALFGLLMLYAVYRMGTHWKDRRTGVLAAAVLGTSYLFVSYWRSAEMDMVFAALITASLAFILAAFSSPEASASATWKITGFWACAGLAFMVKGPFAILLPLAGVVAFAGWSRDGKMARRLFVNTGPLLFMLIVVPYYAYVLISQPQAGAVLGHETVARFSENTDHREAVYYYFLKLIDFAPWLLFLPPALLSAARSKNRQTRLLVSFLAASFLVLTVVPSKKSVYLLPLYPAMALLTAAWLADRFQAGHDAGRIPHMVLRGLAVITLAAALTASGYVLKTGTDWLSALQLAGLALAASVVLLPQITRGKPWPQAPIRFAVGLMLTFCLLLHYLQPQLNHLHSVRDFAIKMGRIVPADSPLYGFMIENQALPFYSQRVIRWCKNLDNLPPDVTYVICRHEDITELQAAGKAAVLLRNRAATAKNAADSKYDLVLLRLHRS